MPKEFIIAVFVIWKYKIFKWVEPQIVNNNINYNLLY